MLVYLALWESTGIRCSFSRSRVGAGKSFCATCSVLAFWYIKSVALVWIVLCCLWKYRLCSSFNSGLCTFLMLGQLLFLIFSFQAKQTLFLKLSFTNFIADVVPSKKNKKSQASTADSLTYCLIPAVVRLKSVRLHSEKQIHYVLYQCASLKCRTKWQFFSFLLSLPLHPFLLKTVFHAQWGFFPVYCETFFHLTH